MPNSARADGKRTAICRACGYPTLGVALCAVCVLALANGQVDLAADVVDDAPDSNPAASSCRIDAPRRCSMTGTKPRLLGGDDEDRTRVTCARPAVA
jgi:hypothetical protein